MKKKCILIFLISLVVLFLLTFLLPDQIAVNSGIGHKVEISVYFILLLSPVPPLCYWSRLRKRERENGKEERKDE